MADDATLVAAPVVTDLASGQPMVFDHPTTYADYYARYPDHIHRMCLAWRCGAQPLEDVEQGLHLYLMTPMRNGRQRLGAYDGTKRGNAVSENAWWSWVNLVLRRQFRHLVDRDNKGGVSGPNIFSVSSWLLDDGGIKPNEDIMSNDDFEKLKFERAPVVDQLLMDRFVAYLETRCPSAMEFFLAIKMCEGDYMEAAYLLDMTETLRARRLKELRSWAGAYMEGMHRPRGARPRIPSIN